MPMLVNKEQIVKQQRIVYNKKILADIRITLGEFHV